MNRIKIIGVLLLFFASGTVGYGQLVTKRDYDAAFAIQAGGEMGIVLSGSSPEMKVRPTAGLKMTFPFTRKWFLGSEINYSRLQTGNRYDLSDYRVLVEDRERWYTGGVETEIKLQRIQVPVYLKYMLRSNRASVLFGIYGSWIYDSEFSECATHGVLDDRTVSPVAGETIENRLLPDGNRETDRWEGGVTVGYEWQIIKHLNLLFRVQVGFKELLKSSDIFPRRLFPLQAGLTLSYDVFRIGDCGCD